MSRNTSFDYLVEHERKRLEAKGFLCDVLPYNEPYIRYDIGTDVIVCELDGGGVAGEYDSITVDTASTSATPPTIYTVVRRHAVADHESLEGLRPANISPTGGLVKIIPPAVRLHPYRPQPS